MVRTVLSCSEESWLWRWISPILPEVEVFIFSAATGRPTQLLSTAVSRRLFLFTSVRLGKYHPWCCSFSGSSWKISKNVISRGVRQSSSVVHEPPKHGRAFLPFQTICNENGFDVENLLQHHQVGCVCRPAMLPMFGALYTLVLSSVLLRSCRFSVLVACFQIVALSPLLNSIFRQSAQFYFLLSHALFMQLFKNFMTKRPKCQKF